MEWWLDGMVAGWINGWMGWWLGGLMVGWDGGWVDNG